MNKRILLVFLMICFMQSCDFSRKDELSNGYVFRNEGSTMKQIISHYPENNYGEIYGIVVDYDFDEHFIIVKQTPNYMDYKMQISTYLAQGFIESDIERDDYERSDLLADSLLKNAEYYKSIFRNKVNYWIMSHDRDRLYGPYTKSDYLLMREKLGVPYDLELE